MWVLAEVIWEGTTRSLFKDKDPLGLTSGTVKDASIAHLKPFDFIRTDPAIFALAIIDLQVILKFSLLILTITVV